MKASKVSTVEEFVKQSPEEARPLLQELRKIIMNAVPDAEETMGYGKPYYKYHGWMTGITLYTKHLGVEIWDGIAEDDRKELERFGYKVGSKNFNIPYDHRIPADILTRMVKDQAARNKAKA